MHAAVGLQGTPHPSRGVGEGAKRGQACVSAAVELNIGAAHVQKGRSRQGQRMQSNRGCGEGAGRRSKRRRRKKERRQHPLQFNHASEVFGVAPCWRERIEAARKPSPANCEACRIAWRIRLYNRPVEQRHRPDPADKLVLRLTARCT